METRFLNLDALRGIAALLVVWQHSSEIFVQNISIAKNGTFLADMASVVDFGRIGVICFFLISGFVIPYSLNPNVASPIRTFVIRRFFRLYPIYWISVLCAAAATVIFSNSKFSGAIIFANFSMIQELLGFPHIQGLYWTLTVELIFYLICAIAFQRSLLNNHLSLLFLTLSSLAIFLSWHVVGKLLPGAVDFPSTITYIPYCISIMFCGSMIRHCYSTKQCYMYVLAALITVFGVPLGILILGNFDINLVQNPSRFGLSHLIGLAIFITVLLAPWTASKPLLWLGLISYSLYLFHPVVIKGISWLIHLSWAKQIVSLHLGFYIAATILLSITVAAITYSFFEHPSITLGRTLTKKKICNPQGAYP